MIKLSRFLLILSGTMFSAFIFMVGLYAASPGFRSILNGAIAGDADIPVVRNDSIGDGFDESETEEAVADSWDNEPQLFITDIDEVEEVALSYSADTDKAEEDEEQPEKIIVDKDYHEDCGTGEGYWVITYSDGSTEIE